MVGIPSYNSYDTSNSTLVPVIASYDSLGNIAPLYVRINGNAFKILAYYRTSEIHLPTFNCKIEHFGYCKDITLVYHPREYVWALKTRST